MNKTSGQISNNSRIERDFNMIQIAFSVIFKGFSGVRSCLRLKVGVSHAKRN